MSTPYFVYLRRVNTIADEPEAGTRCSVERKKEKKERKKDNFEVHPTNTAAKLTGKQDRSTARVGGFNPELVRLRRRSAPVSLVRTLRVLPSRSPSVLVSLSLSLSSLPNLSFSPFLSSSLPPCNLRRCFSLYPFVTLVLTFPFSSVSHFLSSTIIVATFSLSFFLAYDHRVHQLFSPSLRNLFYCFTRFPPDPSFILVVRSGSRSLLLEQVGSLSLRFTHIVGLLSSKMSILCIYIGIRKKLYLIIYIFSSY